MAEKTIRIRLQLENMDAANRFLELLDELRELVPSLFPEPQILQGAPEISEAIPGNSEVRAAAGARDLGPGREPGQLDDRLTLRIEADLEECVRHGRSPVSEADHSDSTEDVP